MSPQVDIAKSHLAKELKVILEEATRRVRLQEGGPGAQLLAMANLGGQGGARRGPYAQVGANRGLGMAKYRTGNVGNTEHQPNITDITEQSNMIASVLAKVEHANSRDGERIENLHVDGEENILDGFLEGFNEEEDSGAGGPGLGPSPWLLGALAGAVVGALVWAGGAWMAQGRR